MDIAAIGLFQAAGSRLDYLAERHRLVAQNVVNANTPGYRSRDLAPFEAVMGGLKPVVAARTDAMHLAGSRSAGQVAEQRRAETWEMNPDGNGVSLEQEMIKASETRETYNLVTGIFQKNVAMLRAAWSSRGS
jgi:flagellar basal-body rod protein FlgB